MFNIIALGNAVLMQEDILLLMDLKKQFLDKNDLLKIEFNVLMYLKIILNIHGVLK